MKLRVRIKQKSHKFFHSFIHYLSLISLFSVGGGEFLTLMHVALGSYFSSPTLSVHGTELWFDDKGLHSLSCLTSPEIIYDVMKVF